MQAKQQFSSPQRIAVIGGGISGLSAAWMLGQRHDVDLYEAAGELGGHAKTVDVECDGQAIPVDAGVIAYNSDNSPNFVAMLRHFQLPTEPADMSVSVSMDRGRFEYCVPPLTGFVRQPQNVLRPYFWRMIADIFRFNSMAFKDVSARDLNGVTIERYLDLRGYSSVFHERYLLPLSSILWASTPGEVRGFAAASLIRFLREQGLMRFFGRPTWRSFVGGSRQYIAKLAASFHGNVFRSAPVRTVQRSANGVRVRAENGAEREYDHIVLAVHADQALSLLFDPSEDERQILGAFSYRRNHAVLHRDPKLMPVRRSVWSSWNYVSPGGTEGDGKSTITCWFNRLRHLKEPTSLFVSLNPFEEPHPDLIITTFEYDHPQFETRAVAAQKRLDRIQGKQRTWYCGSYFQAGLHEHALRSAINVAKAFGVSPPWKVDGQASNNLVE